MNILFSLFLGRYCLCAVAGLLILISPAELEARARIFSQTGTVYVSGEGPRGRSAGPSSRRFSSRDGSVLPCRWISGLVCSSTQPRPRPRLSSWFLRLKMFILWSNSGLGFSEPVGLGKFRLTGSTARPFWARHESSDREESSSCTTTLGSLRASWPDKEAGQQSVTDDAGVWLLGLWGRAVRLPLDRDTLVEPSLSPLPTRSTDSIGLDWMGPVLVGRWTSMVAVVTTRAPKAEAPGPEG